MPLQGKINLNLAAAQYYQQFLPFIDLMKQINTFRVTNNGSTYTTDNPPGTALSAWDGYVDGDGNILNPSPANTTGWAATFYSLGADSTMNGGYIDLSGTEMVCTFEGDEAGTATVTITGENNTVTRVGNRLTWTWGNVTSTRQVTVTGMTASDPVRNLKVFKASNEALLDAGEVWDPRYLDMVRRHSGMIRTMDHQRINFNYATRAYADIPSEAYFAWSRDTRNPGVKGGTPLSALVGIANRVQSHLWTCIPNIFGTLKSAQATAIAKGATTVVTAPGHNFEVGDECIPHSVLGMTEINRGRYDVIAADASTFTLDVDSAGFGTFSYGANFGFFSSPLSLADITTEVTLYATYVKDNLKSFLIPAFEYSNEIWNNSFYVREWLAAQATAATPTGITSGSGRQLYGYIAAHIMKIIRDVYGTSNRALWKGVLATQTADAGGVTASAFVGVNAYITNIEPSLEVSDLFDWLGCTGYWGSSDGGVFASANASNIQTLMATSASRFDSDLEPTKYSYFNRIVNEEVLDGRHYGTAQTLADIPGYWAAQKVYADLYGLVMVHYEHGNHCNMGSSLRDDATMLEFYPSHAHTDEDAANFTKSYVDWENFGGIWPGKFNDSSPITRAASAFGGFRFDGDSNPVMDVVRSVNRSSGVLRQRVQVVGSA